MDEIRQRTYKPKDAWWTVLLVDPVAARLVRVVAPYRWITPNILTAIAAVIGLGAAGCFAMQSRWWLVAGALLFHLSFIIDCMDGKIARLNGTGSLIGAWFDFIFDRIRVFLCAIALFGGQYERTGNDVYLWMLTAVVFLEMFRYLNASQMGKVRQEMRDRLAEAGGPLAAPEDPDADPLATGQADPTLSLKRRVGNWLRARRIRTHLFSGIEYEMTVFIIGPLIGFVIGTSIVAGALLMLFEVWLVFKFLQATRSFPARLEAATEERGLREAREGAPGPLAGQPLTATPARG